MKSGARCCNEFIRLGQGEQLGVVVTNANRSFKSKDASEKKDPSKWTPTNLCVDIEQLVAITVRDVVAERVLVVGYKHVSARVLEVPDLCS